MKLVIRLAQPETDQERMFCVESHGHDLGNPAEVWVVLDGKEYLIEVHGDTV